MSNPPTPIKPIAYRFKKIALIPLLIWIAALFLPAYTVPSNPDTSAVPGIACFLMGWLYVLSPAGLAWIANFPFFVALTRFRKDILDKKTLTLSATASILSLLAFAFRDFPKGGSSDTFPAYTAIGTFVWMTALWLLLVIIVINSRKSSRPETRLQ